MRRQDQQRNHRSLRTRDPFSDLFEDMQHIRERMFSNFGIGQDLFNDDMFSGRMRRFEDFSDFGNLQNFDNFSDQNNGQFYCQSMVRKTYIGPDGKPITEQKIKNKTQKIDQNGQKIVEDNEYYKNSQNNVKRYIKQKTLGDKIIKVKKEKIGNEINEERELHNIDEQEIDDFNRNFQKKQDYKIDRGYYKQNNNKRPQYKIMY